MTLTQLKTLVAVADTGSFYGASERVFLTQSAVSMQMKELEEALGAKLFDRSRRPPRLNATGHLLVDRAREIVRLSDSFLETVPVAGDLFGVLRLGVIPGVTLGILPNALDNLRKHHPRLSFTVQTGLSTGLAADVAQGNLDAAVMTEPRHLEPYLACRTVYTERLIVIAKKDLAGTPDADLLANHPFVYFTRRSNLGRIIDSALIARTIAVKPVMELDSAQGILMMVSLGFGTSIVPERVITPDFREKLYCVPFSDPPVVRQVGLVTRATHQNSPQIDALYGELQIVAERFSNPIEPYNVRKNKVRGKVRSKKTKVARK